MEIKLKSSDFTTNINWKTLAKNLLDFNIGSLVTETIQIDSSKEMKAFLLLFNTVRKTNLELSKQIGQEEITNAKNLSNIYNNIEFEITKFLEEEIIINELFFKNAIQSNPSYLIGAYNLFKKYLSTLKVKVPNNFEYEYYYSFRYNLQDEYQQNKEKYDELLKFFNNPIFQENRKFDKQLEHYQFIRNYFTQSLQSDLDENKETLQDLYIEPNFKIYEYNLKTVIDDGNYVCDFYSPQNNLTIHEFINDYYLKQKTIEDCNQYYNMIFVLGQPGQGKTSFCYKIIHDILHNYQGLPNKPLYFIKIRDLVAKDFIDRPFDTIKIYLNIEIDFSNDNLLLILDGLDEAYMSGGLKNEDLRNLYERLNKTSQQNKNLQIILTSRLNYLNIKDSCTDNSLIIELDVLTDKQVLEYITKYKHFYPDNNLVKSIGVILKDSKFSHIKELLQQAVLMYFIATSNVEINENDSKTIIYDKIFLSLAKRSWDNNKQLKYIKPDLRSDPEKYNKLLRAYIRNIAFAIYKSPNLHITL